MSVRIAGVGMHPFGRFPGHGLKDLARVATIEALVDAGIAPQRVQAVYSSNSLAGLLTGQEQIRGQSVLGDVGIVGVPIVNVENACASGSTALREAVIAIRAGAADVVLALGFEKMDVGDRERTLQALRSAADVEAIAGLGLQFPAIYGMRLQRRLADGSLEPRHLVGAAVKSHAFGSRNPYAQHRRPYTAEEVAGSRMIAEPLTLLMCSSICDGAAAVVVAREGTVERAGPRVAVRASTLTTGRPRALEERATVVTECAALAFAESGVGPADLDVLEVHDAMAPGELLLYEQLGLCGDGEAGELLDRGVTDAGGTHVVNPSGGLTSRGHPVGATGLAQVVELTWQLRGQAEGRQVPGARLGLAQNSGGWVEGESAACAIHVLEAVGS